MMDNKLSELSKPVGFAREEDIKLMQSGKLLSGLTIWRSGKEALYSQEYVSALIQRAERLDSMLTESVQALKAVEQRNAELEAKLSTPVRLPEKYNMKMAGDKSTKSMFYGHNSAINDSTKAIRAAGFTVEGVE